MRKNWLFRLLFVLLMLLGIGAVLFHFRYAIYRRIEPAFKEYRASRIPEGYLIHGIDVSRYQGRIDWDNLGKINKTYPVEFVLIRATMGAIGEDKEFPRNWKAAKRKGLVRGAYHYYNPNVNSSLQAENFMLTVDLASGDLRPVLDIEKVSSVQNIENLRKGIRNWMELVEEHYGVKPILYTYASFYKEYFEGHFDDYPLWVANYNRVNKPIRGEDWIFWQHSETGTIDGIKGYVDLDLFEGDREDLSEWLVE
jgi:lysozyme